jgi:hypothetical protein
MRCIHWPVFVPNQNRHSPDLKGALGSVQQVLLLLGGEGPSGFPCGPPLLWGIERGSP